MLSGMKVIWVKVPLERANLQAGNPVWFCRNVVVPEGAFF